MSVLRQLNLLSQMRLDVPHLRTLDSSVAGDFDTVIGRVAAGERALVVRGFTMSNVGGVAATALELNTADAILYNLNASESGSFLWVPSDRTAEVLDPTSNGAIDGSWTSSAVNYVGLDLLRGADSDTTDIVQFKDANTGLETPRSVPTAKTLDYRIVISTTPFASQANLVPIAKVTLNGSGVVTAMSDSRNMMFRLGRGGDSPDAEYAHSWAASRAESTALDNTLFVGADKAISSEKEWMDSIMTRLWELGGGENWYSATSDRNCTQVNTGATFSNGEYFDWDGVDLLWKDLTILFDNSTAYYNTVSGQAAPSVGLTDLADGECIYVEVDRANNAAALTAQKSDLATLGAGTPPGSVWVLAWRRDTEVFTRGSKYGVGNWISVATASSTGIVKLSRAASTPPSPIVIADTGGSVLPVTAVTALSITGYSATTSSQIGLDVTGGAVSSGSTMPLAACRLTGGTQSGGGVGGIALTAFGGGSSGSTYYDGGTAGYFLGGTTTSGIGGYGVFAYGGAGVVGHGGTAVVGIGDGTAGGAGGYSAIYKEVPFDTQTAAFTVGQVVTGGTSGAAGTIIYQYDGGASGILVIQQSNSKSFVNNETLTDPLGGSADANLPNAGGNGGWFVGGVNHYTNAGRRCLGMLGVGGDNNGSIASFDTSVPEYPLSAPGVGVVGIGGGGTYGADGGQFFGIGDDGTSGRVGAVGVGAPVSSAAKRSGSGFYGSGADSSAGGLIAWPNGAGHGLYGLGGDSSGQGSTSTHSSAGYGVYGQGGVPSDGIAGHGVYGVGGTTGAPGGGGYGVYGQGGAAGSTTSGHGGYFVAGSGQTIGCAVPATNDFGYASARTYYKWILADDLHTTSGGTSILYAGDNTDLDYWVNGTGETIVVSGRVDIPAGATITDVGFCAWNDSGVSKDFTVWINDVVESGGALVFSSSVSGTATVTVTDPGAPVYTIHSGVTGLSITNPSGQLSTGVQCYRVGVYTDNVAIGDNTIRLLGIRITYTMTALATNI